MRALPALAIAFLSAGMLGGVAEETSSKISAHSQVTVTVSPGGAWQRTIVNQGFLGATLYAREGLPFSTSELVLQQTLTRKERSGLDDDDVHLETTAYPGEGPGALGKQLWTAVDHADSGRAFDGRFYVATLLARGPGDDLHRYRDLASGRFVFAASTAPLRLDPRHFKEARWIAYWSSATPERHPCRVEGDLGWLTVVGKDGSTRQVAVAHRDPHFPAFTPDWGIVDPRNGKVVGRFPDLVREPFPLPAELRFTFDGESRPQVRLPLLDGDVDPARAVLAPGFRVERRACAGQEPQPWP
jgi:hypothetical protein